MTQFTRRNPTDQTALHGRILAQPKKPRAVIAIVHGFGEHIGRYAPIAPRFAEAGMAVIGLDLHGHGRTPGRRGFIDHYERLREDVDMLILEAETRFPGVPLFVWGHSMGGGLVLDYVLDRGAGDLRGVIATAPLIEAVDAPPGPIMWLMRQIGKIKPSFSIANKIAGDQISTLPEEQARYEADEFNHDRLGVGLGLGMLNHGKALLNRGARFPLPLMLAHARGDQLTRYEASEQFAQTVPQCNFYPFTGVEHEIHNDASRAELLSKMTQFVETQI